MNEDVKPENMRIHSRTDELIACLEGEIAKRDAELAACRVAVENCEVFRARIAELEGALSWHEEQRNDMVELRTELAALKAQGVVMQATDGGRNPRYEGLFDGETEEHRASRLAAHSAKGVV